MEYNEKITKYSRNRLIVTENRLTAIRGEVGWGAGQKSEEIKQRKKKTLIDRENSMVITRGKWR